MTDTVAPDTRADSLIEELSSWLAGNWDPDLTVAEWWKRLGLAGWSAPGLPTNAYGRGLSRNDVVRVQQTISDFGALAAPGGLGLMLAAPTIATHGTQEQIDIFIRAIVTGQQAWCQLFSEPGAGSDLAGLQARAVRDGDEWIVTGQKVWTSGGQIANLGMLIARTNPDSPKHSGITYFAIDMDQPGVETRPLREMTGHAIFNEVFLTEARVPDAARIGELNGGWAVANTTLMHERASLGAGGGSTSASVATPGTIAKDLDRRAGEFVGSGTRRRRGGSESMLGGSSRLLIELAKGNGTIKDPVVRQDLVRLHSLNEVARFNNLRAKAAKEAGRDIPGLPNLAKLSMSRIVGLSRDLGLRIAGPYGTLHAYDAASRSSLDQATGNPFLAMVTEMALFAQAPPIYGGTDQVQRNIIGERVLGLPKEPNIDKTTAFKDLPKNS